MSTPDRFPMMVFRAPGLELLHGVKCETRIVDNDDDLDEAQDSGWWPTATAADEALKAEKAQAAERAAAEALALAEAEAELRAAAIRAPLEAQITGLQAQLASDQEKHAKAQQDLADERAAHAKTKAAAVAPKPADDKPDDKAASKTKPKA